MIIGIIGYRDMPGQKKKKEKGNYIKKEKETK